jgi:hypothetical protein
LYDLADYELTPTVLAPRYVQPINAASYIMDARQVIRQKPGGPVALYSLNNLR